MTQIATNKDQSARLIACGLDPKSADMCYLYWNESGEQLSREEYLEIFNESFLDGRIELVPKDFGDYDHSYENDSPAWSLLRLLSLLPKDLMWQGLYYRLVMGPNEKGWEIEYNDLSVLNNLHRTTADNLIEAVVKMIEWLSQNGYKLNEITQ